jgi:hypothetical protein
MTWGPVSFYDGSRFKREALREIFSVNSKPEIDQDVSIHFLEHFKNEDPTVYEELSLCIGSIELPIPDQIYSLRYVELTGNVQHDSRVSPVLLILKKVRNICKKFEVSFFASYVLF